MFINHRIGIVAQEPVEDATEDSNSEDASVEEKIVF